MTKRLIKHTGRSKFIELLKSSKKVNIQLDFILGQSFGLTFTLDDGSVYFVSVEKFYADKVVSGGRKGRR